MKPRFLRRTLCLAFAAGMVAAVTACQSLRQTISVGSEESMDAGLPAGDLQLSGELSMKALGHDLDHLERHIDWHGSVVAKVPDVWGQARLTQYRDEFEKAMAIDKSDNAFRYIINGAQSRSDQMFFVSATALSAAAQPRPPVIGRVSTSTTANTQQAANSSQVKPLDLDAPKDLLVSPDKVTQTAVRLPNALGFQGGTKDGTIGIEPTEYLAQKQRYLNFLHQLRRENEGDDTADSPGYSLNLLRIPVSVLPGKKTEVGFAAEITMTLNPILGDDLLPMTFRNLLVNDVENQLGFPMVGLLGDPILVKSFLTAEFELFIHTITRTNDYLSLIDPANAAVPPAERDWAQRRMDAYVTYLKSDPAAGVRAALWKFGSDDMKALYFTGLQLPKPKTALTDQTQAATASRSTFAPLNKIKTFTDGMGNDPGVNIALKAGAQVTNSKAVVRATGLTAYSLPAISFANGLDNRTAFPTSQLYDVYGSEALFDVTYAIQKSFAAAIKKQGYVHLPDIQTQLREEARAAAEFLKKNPHLWSNYCTEHLVQAIRSQQWDEVLRVRQAYRKEVAFLTKSEPTGTDAQDVNTFDPNQEPLLYSGTTGLGWCLIVDAALLNDRLIRDMKETASSKGLALAGCDHWCPYFLPDPPAECRKAFNDYVRLRWPIHVFALDPYTQEQNIADSLSTRREIQLALSIAFTNGMMSARQLTRFSRRLEAEYETIALNRTQYGFGHGENTFGWRFYPRFQTPDTPSNAQALIREGLIGGPSRDALLRQRRLEPGWRECVAVVMMPSFVPYVEVDTVSNWFPITNPKHKCLDHSQALKLSKTVQTIKMNGCGVTDADQYLPGDAKRLMVCLEQLQSRLPMQTLTSAVPILNTLGGFEMFSNGTTDLAPELFGWYGAPGIDPDADTTTLFLVGDHFSPLRTRVIVGNQAVDNLDPKFQTLLSRQVMQVTFTRGAYTVPDAEGGKVRIHVATPYGVTRELEVPVVKRSKPAPAPTPPPAPPKTGFFFGDARLTVNYGVCAAEAGKFRPLPQGSGNDGDLKIAWNAPGTVLPPSVAVDLTFEYSPPGSKTIVTIKIPCQGRVIGQVTEAAIVLPKATLDAIAADLVGQIAAAGSLPLAPNPLDAGLKSTTATITPLVPPGVFAQGAPTADQLSVEFKATGACAPWPAIPGQPGFPRLPAVKPATALDGRVLYATAVAGDVAAGQFLAAIGIASLIHEAPDKKGTTIPMPPKPMDLDSSPIVPQQMPGGDVLPPPMPGAWSKSPASTSPRTAEGPILK
jgi:hypothetical protein